MNRRRIPLVLTAATLVFAACSSGDDDSSGEVPPAGTEAPTTVSSTVPTTTAPVTTAPPATTPATSSPPTTAPVTTMPPSTVPSEPFAPVGVGPFDVGVSTVTIGEGSDRPLTVEVWYPLADGAGLEPHQYTLLPGAYYESPLALSATPDLIADGSFPLIVYSHGSGGLRFVQSSYTEAVASHGYVVVAADHTGNTVLDLVLGTTDEYEQITLDRPNDVADLIDAFTGDAVAPAATPWVGSVDADQVAVSGHSFGGFTSVASVTGYANPLGEIAADPRVDGIITFAPATDTFAPAIEEPLLSDEVLSTIDVPMLIVAGTSDDSTPIDPNVTRMWDLNDNSPAYRADLIDAEHQTFTDLCAYLRFLPELSEVPAFITDTVDERVGDACSPEAMDDRRAADLTNTYSVLFLDELLRAGDPITLSPPDDVIYLAR